MRSATHIAGMEPDGTRFGVREPADRRDALTTRADLDEAVELLKRMPPRLKRIAFLRAIGLEYREISEVTGDSPRRVGQLVAAANQHIYEERARRAAERGELAPRAKRLADLEGNPPAWLSERIGRAPSMLNRRVPRATELLAWRRAALALDDYRRDHAPGGDGSRLGSVPDSSAGRRAWGQCSGRFAASRHSETSTADGSASDEGRDANATTSLGGMTMSPLVPVEYCGDLVALVSARRFHIVAPWLADRPAGDPDLRFVAYMCACYAEITAGPPTRSVHERRRGAVGRGALVDLRTLEQDGASDEDLAARWSVPVAQIRIARSELRGE